MLRLYDKITGKSEDIYGAESDNCGYPKLLIRKDNQWVWRSAKHYITEEEYEEIINESLAEQQELAMQEVYEDIIRSSH